MILSRSVYYTGSAAVLWAGVAVLTAATLHSFYRYFLSVINYFAETGSVLSAFFILLTFIFVNFPAVWTLAVSVAYLCLPFRRAAYDGFLLALLYIICIMTLDTPVLRQIY